MNEFDNKQMPYTVPQDFFEASRARLHKAILRRRLRRISLWSGSIAAALVAGIVSFYSLTGTPSYERYCQSYVQSLSDDELGILVDESDNDLFLTLN